jgi:hypothetical protein
MGKYASGKHAIAISDRSGMRFPYREMVKEWNGMWVHYTEYEPKQPQLELAVIGADGIGLEHPRPEQRATPTVPVMLPENPFETYTAGSGLIFVHSPSHRRNEADTVRFRGVPDQSTSTGNSQFPPTNNGAPGFSNCRDVDGIPGSSICAASGYAIDVGKGMPLRQTTLVDALDDSQTTGIKLTNATAFSGVTTNDFLRQAIMIDNELIRYTTIAADNSLGQVSPEATAINPNVVTRGAYGTTAATHNAGATVTLIEDPDNYFQFTQATNASVGGIQGGGFPVSAGPVTITP